MGGYVYPVSTKNVSDDFSEHVDRGSPNPGTDYTSAYGSPVYAPYDGTIVGVHSSNSGGGGRMVYIDLDDGNGIDLLHLSSIVQSSGRIRAGVLVGYSGASGYGDDWYYGPHLHISIRNRHGSHTYNAGNFDFDAYLRGGAAGGGEKPVEERKRNVSTIYHWIGEGPTTFALAGDSPGTTANWIETRDGALASAWATAHGASVLLTGSDFADFREWYRQPMSTTGGGSGGDSAATIADAVEAELAPRFDAIPEAGENANATVDALGQALVGDSRTTLPHGIAAAVLLVAGVWAIISAIRGDFATALFALAVGAIFGGIAFGALATIGGWRRRHRNY